MDLHFSFLGIELAADGMHARAKVRAQPDEADVPAGLAVPRIDITVPLTTGHLALPTAGLAAQTLQAARRFVNPQAVADWVRQAQQP